MIVLAGTEPESSPDAGLAGGLTGLAAAQRFLANPNFRLL
jgi:hypothetical protein